MSTPLPQKRAFLGLLLGGLMFSSGATAFAQEPTGAEAGRELAAQIISKRPEENSSWKGTLKISQSGQPTVTLPVSCQTVVNGASWSVTYQTPGTAGTPAEKLVVDFSAAKPPVYHYQKAPQPGAPLPEARELKAEEADVPFAGSDFWLSDLAFQFYHWPDQKRRKGIVRRTQPCYVMESFRPKDSKGAYSKVVTWIERKSEMPLDAEAYGDGNKVIKEFEIGSVGKVHGRYQVKNIKMYDRRTDSKTVIEFDFGDEK